MVHELFSNIVDYAGLFPPAGLPLDKVVSNYENYLDSKHRWMLARLILPAGKLTEFEQLPTFAQSTQRWQISALIPPFDAPNNGFESALSTINEFNARHTNKAVVDAIEVKAPTVSAINDTISKLPATIDGFLEIPHKEDPSELIVALKAASQGNAFAKIRTGGVTQDLIPDSKQVARFIRACAEHDVGFKATAGLHHPLRGDYRLTYDADPDMGTMFGFANVFIAACFAFANNADADNLASILTTSDASQFEVTESGITWNSQTVTAAAAAEIRKNKATSFGSCSFEEPTAELAELGWIE